jgi:site-specific recombinase XerD
MTKKLNTFNDTHHFSTSDSLQSYLDTFTNKLSELGCTNNTIRLYHCTISHLDAWLRKNHTSIKDINEETVNQFLKHKCNCKRGGLKNKVSIKSLKRINRFIIYLSEQGVLDINLPPTKEKAPPLIEKFKTYLQTRGLAISTIKNYEHAIRTILPLLNINSSVSKV